MRFFNSTGLDGCRLERLLLRHTLPFRHDKLTVRIRYSRGADFSGACYYRGHRIFINLGRHNRYPYRLGTNIARARSNRTHWWRETYALLLDVAVGRRLLNQVFLPRYRYAEQRKQTERREGDHPN